MTAQLAPNPVFRATDGNGAPLFQGQLFTYAAGTTTPQATYVDSTQTTPNANPVILNARGECPLWLDPTKSYKFDLFDKNGNHIPGWPVDNIAGGSLSGSIIPTVNNLFTLGNPSFSFANLYLGPNGAAVLDTVSGNIGYYARTAAEIAASVTPIDFAWRPLDPKRYGLVGDGAHPTQDAAAWVSWRAVMGNTSSVSSQQDCRDWSRAEPTSMGLGPGSLQACLLGSIENTAYGHFTLGSLTTGQANLAIGYSAMTAATVAQFMTSVGINSSLLYTSGIGFNSVFGYGAYARGLTGFNNNAYGFESLHDNGAGNDNIAIGAGALHSGTNGSPTPAPADPSNSIGIGSATLKFNYGSSNIAIGHLCMQGISTSSYSSGGTNIGIGQQVMTGLTSAIQNNVTGHLAGFSITTSSSNCLYGHQTGQALISGTGLNVAVGESALFWDTTAAQNVAVGANALTGTNGSNGKAQNTAVGNNSMQLCTTPGNCSAFGNLSLRNVTTGNHIVAVGDSAFINETTGTNNVAVGDNAGASQTAGFTNTNNFGFGSFSTASNQVTLGNSSIATLRCQQTSITALSDRRDKTAIEALELGLDFINAVPFRRFKRAHRDGSRITDTFEAGIIAQELQELQIRFKAEWMGLVDKTDPDRLEATPGKLLYPMGVAIQELSARLANLESFVQYKAAA